MNGQLCERKPIQAEFVNTNRLRSGIKAGTFWIIGFICAGYISTEDAQVSLYGKTYTVYADFESVDGLRAGSPIEISGVRIGTVERISLTDKDMARVEMQVKEKISLPKDSMVSIKSRGLLGNKILCVFRGGSNALISPGEVVKETVPGIDFEKLIGKFIFGHV